VSRALLKQFWHCVKMGKIGCNRSRKGRSAAGGLLSTCNTFDGWRVYGYCLKVIE
jgi:hypothetical protein